MLGLQECDPSLGHQGLRGTEPAFLPSLTVCFEWEYIGDLPCCVAFLGVQPLDSLVLQFSSVQFSRSVVSDSLRPHESQHARPPCPSPTPGVHPNSLVLSHMYICFSGSLPISVITECFMGFLRYTVGVFLINIYTPLFIK